MKQGTAMPEQNRSFVQLSWSSARAYLRAALPPAGRG